MAKMKLGILIMVFALGLHGAGWSLNAGADIGFVSMDYMNDLLQEAGLRAGMSVVPMRTALAWDVQLRPWPFLGIGVARLATSGKLVGRDEQGLSTEAYIFQGDLGIKTIFFGQTLHVSLSLGVIWSTTAGLVEGRGWGWNTSLTVAWPALHFLNLNLGVKAGYRWAVVPALQTAREELRPVQRPVLDFSGPFWGIVVCWEG